MTRLIQIGFIASVFLLSHIAAADGADDTLIFFSSSKTSPDRYADGSVVMDGECYVLVWSQDGEFNGFHGDGSPVDPKDKVILVAPVAEEGHCPPVLFQVSASVAAQLSDGVYAVYLLDTRVTENGQTIPKGLTNGRIEIVNGFGCASTKVTCSTIATIGFPEKQEGRAIIAEETIVVEKETVQPRIKKIWMDARNVFFKVENLQGYIRIYGGAVLNRLTMMGGATKASGEGDDVIIVVPQIGNVGFFKAVRNLWAE